MKLKLFLLMLMLFSSMSFTHGQNQVNYWMSGYHAMIKFDASGAHYEYRNDFDNVWRASASISDANGNLLFYTNGYRVFNKNFQVMQNGDDLNIGDYEQLNYDVLPLVDGAVIVPVPTDSEKYYLFHSDLDFTTIDGSQLIWPRHIFYCLIDMELESGLGAIVVGQKDIEILNDTITQFGMQAVRHGNGRDWWLLTHEYGSNRYYRFLIDPTGIHGPYEQSIGIIYEKYNAEDASPMRFSQNGLMFAQLASDSNCFELYDFDRCTGLLSNYRRVETSVPDDNLKNEGISFSPSGQYIYVSRGFTEIWQYDLQAADIASSAVLVGIDDGISDPFPAMFYYSGIGPDNKVYIVDYNGAYSLNVIEQPDIGGILCNFIQRGLPIDSPSSWFASMPNIPNYSLGPLNGSGCDTIVGTNELPTPVFTYGVYPNPFIDELQLSITGAATKSFIEIYDVLGKKIYSSELSPNNYFIHQVVDLSNVASGIYFIKLDVNGNRYTRKVVKK